MMQLTRLPNGLRVASRAMQGFETTAVGLYAEAGSRHEPAELNGIAHLFEHMVFKGAGGRSAREISETIEDAGGDLNACTERDGTSFTATVLGEDLPLAIELLTDLVLRPHLDAEELEREKQVVLQELAEARDTPGDIIFDELWAASYEHQAMGRSILGDEDSVGRIQVSDLRAWREQHFDASNICLVAAGKVDHAALIALAERHLANLPSGMSSAHEPAVFTGGRRVLRKRNDQAHLTLAFEGPSTTHEDYHAARLFTDIVGGGASSRLFQELREERGLAYSVSASLHPYSDTGLLSVHAATASRDALAAAQLIDRVLADATRDLTQREVDRARTQARAALLMSLESTWGQTNYIARQLSTRDRLVDPAEHLAALGEVTVEQVRDVGQRMLVGPRATATIGAAAARAA